ncbi:hypothetical protein BDV36DRAFT_162891 [Aspergillus pseudocaelatus]|uniref:Uncharacterized protein n=1 Tax=Aspergillus pseudocaelatus TaxID=1825620 RepID=A0ABQ6WMK4_9EURO|nr:hypothetical protein BDV36DRAFT_162891 [Aspergillus pseudocaelatus]
MNEEENRKQGEENAGFLAPCFETFALFLGLAMIVPRPFADPPAHKTSLVHYALGNTPCWAKKKNRCTLAGPTTNSLF